MNQTIDHGARPLAGHRPMADRPPSWAGAPLEEHEADLVRDTALFSGLTDDVCAELLGRMTAYNVPAGGIVYGVGDPGDSIYIVLQGRLQAYRDDEYGRRRMLRIITESEMVGYFSIVDHLPRSATVSALSESRLAVLADGHLDELLATQPRAALNMIGYLAARLRRSNEAVADMALMDVRARVSKTILELSARFGSPHPDGLLIDHGLNQQDLAHYVGASREMVNRVLSDLQTRGMVRVRPGSMLVTQGGIER